MTKKSKKQSLHMLALVAIVAIVGITVIILQGASSTLLSGDLTGYAFIIKKADITPQSPLLTSSLASSFTPVIVGAATIEQADLVEGRYYRVTRHDDRSLSVAELKNTETIHSYTIALSGNPIIVEKLAASDVGTSNVLMVWVDDGNMIYAPLDAAS